MFHFIYESILSPMLRLEIRYKLFETRDKLRSLKINNKETCNDETFEMLDDYACRTINMLPIYNLSNLFHASKVKMDDEMKNRIHKHEKLIKESNIPELKIIDKDITKAAVRSFIVNSGGWMYIVIPIVLLVLIISFITQTYSNLKFRMIKSSYKMSYTGETLYGQYPMMYDL
ncbi:hypothetical protein CMU20_17525 [Elizabethkingia anophelis]|nr:hypothetical protein [Elizabethkingia anophelis]